jgi:hypothetical protein
MGRALCPKQNEGVHSDLGGKGPRPTLGPDAPPFRATHLYTPTPAPLPQPAEAALPGVPEVGGGDRGGGQKASPSRKANIRGLGPARSGSSRQGVRKGTYGGSSLKCDCPLKWNAPVRWGAFRLWGRTMHAAGVHGVPEVYSNRHVRAALAPLTPQHSFRILRILPWVYDVGICDGSVVIRARL